jgi:hypothetical protein
MPFFDPTDTRSSTRAGTRINFPIPYFGKYHGDVTTGHAINSGLYGMPPGFDFEAKIKEVQKDDRVRAWESRFDDQGLSRILSVDMPFILLEQDKLPCCDFEHVESEYGWHLVGANRADYHPTWERIKRQIAFL